jgi:hypothetical protein
MEFLLLPITIPCGVLALWFKSKRRKHFKALWSENDWNTLNAEGVAFLLGIFSVSMGLALFGFLIAYIVSLVLRLL